MQRTVGTFLFATLLIGLAAGPVAAGAPRELARHVHFMPTKAAVAQADATARHAAKPGGGGLTQAGIYQHGGPIITQMRVASIYWSAATIFNGGPAAGSQGSGSQDGSLVGLFLRNLGGTPYYNINKGYWDRAGGTTHWVSGSLAYSGFWADDTNAPSGSQNVSDGAVQAEIAEAFSSGTLAYDPSTIYAVFTGPNVNLGGGAFTQYCAYHGYFSLPGVGGVVYAVMPYNASSTSCMAQTLGPNGAAEIGADSEVNTLAHEIEEANTDPQLTAWWDRRGQENADKCAWTWGTTSTASNGAIYNMTIGARKWLVQRNWLNSGRGSCSKG